MTYLVISAFRWQNLIEPTETGNHENKYSVNENEFTVKYVFNFIIYKKNTSSK